MDMSWDEAYAAICAKGFELKVMPSFNEVWRAYLKSQGFRRYAIPDTYPYSYSVREFCSDNPTGKYLVFVGGHVVAVENGDYYDSWDSGHEVPLFYWRKEK